MLDLNPNDPIIKTYLKDIQHLESQQVSHELGLKGPFQNLLDKAAKKRGWTLVAELSTFSGGRRIVPDGAVRDEFRLPRGWWEAKDTSDKLAAEIQKKLKAGYPAAIPSSKTPAPPSSTRTGPKLANLRSANPSRSPTSSIASSLTTNRTSANSSAPWRN